MMVIVSLQKTAIALVLVLEPRKELLRHAAVLQPSASMSAHSVDGTSTQILNFSLVLGESEASQ